VHDAHPVFVRAAEAVLVGRTAHRILDTSVNIGQTADALQRKSLI